MYCKVVYLQLLTLVGLTGPIALHQLKHIADKQVADRLQQVSGVAAVTAVGGADHEIQIALDKGKLKAYELSINDVINALGAATLNLPSGRIRETEKEFPVRLIGEFTSVEQVEKVRLHFTKKGEQPGLRLQLKDMAQVLDTVSEPQYFARANGKEAVVLSVQKTSDANTVEVVEGVCPSYISILTQYRSARLTTARSRRSMLRLYLIIISLRVATKSSACML